MYKRKNNKRKSRPIIKRYKPNVYNKYSAKKKTQEIKTCDMTFNGNYNHGNYTPDQTDNPQLMINIQGSIQNLACIQQGTGVSQRIGNKIALKSLRIRLALSAIDNHEYDIISEARLMVVYDRQPNGVYPTMGNMLQLIKQDGTTAFGTEVSNINVSQLDRYVVLMDKILSLPPQTTGLTNANMVGVTQQSTFIIDEFIKLKRLETCFQSSNNPITIGDVQTGALYIVSLGNLAKDSEPYGWSGEMRLRFYDN